MATDEDKETDLALVAHRNEPASARTMFDVLLALQGVAKGELSRGPSVASNAWRKLYDVIAETLGDDHAPKASPVVGRQPVVMPPGYKHPIPAKGGAKPIRPDQGTQPHPGQKLAGIKQRPDVAAELERLKRGGK